MDVTNKENYKLGQQKIYSTHCIWLLNIDHWLTLLVFEPGSYIAQVDLQFTNATEDDHDLGMCYHAQFLW